MCKVNQISAWAMHWTCSWKKYWVYRFNEFLVQLKCMRHTGGVAHVGSKRSGLSPPLLSSPVTTFLRLLLNLGFLFLACKHILTHLDEIEKKEKKGVT